MDVMQRIIPVVLLFFVVQANAIYISTSVGDSRLQSNNKIYKPGGIIHWAFEIGFFNEPENESDYKLSFGIDRFGYSHSDGKVSVSFQEAYFKPAVFSTTTHNIMFEFAPYAGWLMAANNLTEYCDSLFFVVSNIGYRITLGYEYRLGYQINKAFLAGITANYHWLPYGIPHNKRRKEHPLMGGWGLNFQYNLPW